ncbi:hypothetical protein [Nitrolancea hollandica]|uniref:Uncharacterized protein n=1 Tax=Nitrolancea hollandica Lb TaxID=1129897 RepID=I4EJN2_9BACT|nr:hypothetical protein [Nitrolancea hollandica]CCF84894.1 conserved hypothetical protein [Nitrolancea hollandica Lb]
MTIPPAAQQPVVVAITAAMQDAANKLGIPINEIDIERLDRQEWPDSCLGCPQPEEACLEVITPGYRILLGGSASGFVYHTDTQGNVRHCPTNQSPSAAEEPHLFELQGIDTEITYSTSSFAGPPQLSYRGPGLSTGQQLERSFSGDEIRVREQEIGRLVTVTLEAIPDADTLTLTLLVPAFRLDGTESPCSTVAILTTHRGSIAPQTLMGQLQSFQALELTGTASRVFF